MNWHGPKYHRFWRFQVFSLGMAYEKGLENTCGIRQLILKTVAKVDDEV